MKIKYLRLIGVVVISCMVLLSCAGKKKMQSAPQDPAVLYTEGMVLFKGERWTAESEEGRIEPGDTVVINKVDSLKLFVTKKQ